MAFDAVEPFGEIRADLRMAILASVFANAHAPRGKSFKAADFMPRFDPPWMRRVARAVPAETMLAQIEAITKAFGGRDLRGEAAHGD